MSTARRVTTAAGRALDPSGPQLWCGRVRLAVMVVIRVSIGLIRWRHQSVETRHGVDVDRQTLTVAHSAADLGEFIYATDRHIDRESMC